MKRSFMELQSPLKRCIDIKITLQLRNGRIDLEQFLEHVNVSSCMNSKQTSILLHQLMALLNLRYNIPVQDRQIFYYLPEGQLFINCGVYPLSQEITAQWQEITQASYMYIKVKELGLMHVERLMLTQSEVVGQKEEPEEEQGKKQGRRMKERRIDHIIGKVIEWRKYYSGTIDESRQHQKLSLEEAAKRVGISKKSLDDYLFQIRLGFNYGFNFNEHYGEKVGILRDFVRQQKKLASKTENKSRKRRGKQRQ